MGLSRHRRVLQKTLIEIGAKSKAAIRGAKLPPGRLRVPQEGESRNQDFLLKRATELGPIFKVWLPHKMTTCIVGHEMARRFLSENEGKIRAGTPDLTPLFPHGFLRALEGPIHRKYRKLFSEAFKATPLEPHLPTFRAMIREGLERLASLPQPIDNSTMRHQLKQMTTRVFLQLILGVAPDSAHFDEFVSAYDAYAPNGVFIVVRPRHEPLYKMIRGLVLRQAEELQAQPSAPPSLLRNFVRLNALDETVIGNMVQMVEASRYDVHGLWLWLVKHLGDSAETIELAREQTPRKEGDLSAIWAIPRETLRMEQSELLLRVAVKDIVFDGYFIPKGTHIRICVWEAHHDRAIFREPFRYDCTRFMDARIKANDYSPFGLDKHRCLGADWTFALSELFVEELARNFELATAVDGDPSFGRFHYEPSTEFAVNLSVLKATASSGILPQ